MSCLLVGFGCMNRSENLREVRIVLRPPNDKEMKWLKDNNVPVTASSYVVEGEWKADCGGTEKLGPYNAIGMNSDWKGNMVLGEPIYMKPHETKNDILDVSEIATTGSLGSCSLNVSTTNGRIAVEMTLRLPQK